MELLPTVSLLKVGFISLFVEVRCLVSLITYF